jgi:hypothetical protein
LVNRGGEGSYLAILGFGPLVFANVGVNLMAPTLRALLAGAAGHLGGDGGPSVAVLGLKCGELDVFDVGPWRTLEV